jgi:hypothetical protein
MQCKGMAWAAAAIQPAGYPRDGHYTTIRLFTRSGVPAAHRGWSSEGAHEWGLLSTCPFVSCGPPCTLHIHL